MNIKNGHKISSVEKFCQVYEGAKYHDFKEYSICFIILLRSSNTNYSNCIQISKKIFSEKDI